MDIHKPLSRVARRLRQRQSDAERLMWSLLGTKRFEGSKFRRQHPMKDVVLDFYCPALKLNIELDGGQHFTPEGLEADRRRDEDLQSLGITVLRFDDYAFFTQRDGVMKRIYETLMRLCGDHVARPSPHLSPEYRGEGPEMNACAVN